MIKLRYVMTEENYKDFLIHESDGKRTISMNTIQILLACLLAIQIVITMMIPILNKWHIGISTIRSVSLIILIVLLLIINKLRQPELGALFFKRNIKEKLIPEGFLGIHELEFMEDGFKQGFGPFRKQKSYSSIIEIKEYCSMIHLKQLGDTVLIPYRAFASREGKDDFLRFIKEKKQLCEGEGFDLKAKIRENKERPEQYYRYHLSQQEALDLLTTSNRILGLRRMMSSTTQIFYLILSVWGIITMLFVPRIRTETMVKDVLVGELWLLILLVFLNIHLIWLLTPWITTTLNNGFGSDGSYQNFIKPQWLFIRQNCLVLYQDTLISEISIKDVLDVRQKSKCFCIILKSGGFVFLPTGLFATPKECLDFKCFLLNKSNKSKDFI